MSSILLSIILLTGLLLHNCSPQPEDHLASTYADSTVFSLDKYAGIEPVRSAPHSELEDWNNYYFDKSDCRCLFDGEFFISVNDKYPGSKKLMITLQGGGASWPGLEASKESVSEDDVFEAEFATILAEKLNEEWNQVMIPYCDGSLYAGDRAADYDNDGYVDHWHWGFRNISAAMVLTNNVFPDLEEVFITGCSAGGYGTFTLIRLVRNFYPEAEIYVLNESGPGLFNPDDVKGWSRIKDTWKLDQMIPDDCDVCDGQMIYWYDKYLERDPDLKIGLYSSYQDFVLYDEFLDLEPEDFRSLLLETTGYLHEKYPSRFNRFIVLGESHCVEDRNYHIEGISYWDWVLHFMNDSEQWTDLLE